MMNHNSTEVFFDNMEVSAENLIGEEGQGFRYILSGMNAERVLIASECIGDGKWFIEKAVNYAKERKLFGRPIGQNQGVQYPIARAYTQIEAADLMVRKAASMYEAGINAGAEANMAKMLASEASWACAEMCVQTHGGFGFAEEYDVERKFREARLYTVAPISTNMILNFVAEHVLGPAAVVLARRREPGLPHEAAVRSPSLPLARKSWSGRRLLAAWSRNCDPRVGQAAQQPRAERNRVSASSSAATCLLKATRDFAKSSLTPGPKNCSEKPLVAFGPSGVQTSIDRLGKPGLMLIVRFGHRKWYCDCVTAPRDVVEFDLALALERGRPHPAALAREIAV